MFEIELRVELREKINHCQELLERIYVEIGGNYSSLMSSLEDGLKGSRSAVEQFRHYIFDSNDSVILAVTKIESRVNASLEYFKSLDQDAKEISDKVSGNLNLIGSIRDEINEIRKSAEIMQVLALKGVSETMSRVGGGGNESDEAAGSLQDKALAGVEISDELFQISSRLQDDFNEISNALINLSSTEEKLCRMTEEAVMGNFDEVKSYIRDFVSFLEELEKDAAQIRGPLFSIMQNLQYQDILRQSLDHVSLFLDRVEELPPMESDEEEHLLDIYTLFEMISEFSVSVFYEARDRLNENVRDFDSHTRTIIDIIKLIDSKRLDLIARHRNDSATDKGAHMLAGMRKKFHKLIANLEDSLEMEKLVDPGNTKLPDILAKFREKNSEFDELSRSMKEQVAGGGEAQAEAVKEEIISTFDTAFSDINRLLESLGERIDNLADGSQLLEKTGDELSDKCRKLFEANREMGETLSQSMEQLFGFIETTRGQVLESVDSFSVFSEYFLKLIEKTYEGIQSLRDYSVLLEESVEISRKIGYEAATRKGKILQKRGVEGWSVQNEEIMELINRFTLFRHREKASALTGHKVTGHDVGEGSISLF